MVQMHDARGGVERVARKALDDVLLGELEVVVRRGVLLELLERLVAEVAAVHQEQHAPRAGELDEPVYKGDGREGLAGARGHLDQRAGSVFGQGLFEIPDGGALRRPEACLDERRHVLHAAQEGGAAGHVLGRGLGHLGCFRGNICGAAGVGEPVGQCFGLVEGEDRAGAGRLVETVRKAGFHAGGLVGERERAAPGGQGVWQAGGVFAGLRLHADERGAGLLGFDDAGGFAVHVEHVVGEAVALLQLELADGDAAVRGDVGLVGVAHGPAGRGEQLVDLVACELFGRRQLTASAAKGFRNITDFARELLSRG